MSIFLLGISACVKQPEFSVVPAIEFRSLSATSVNTSSTGSDITDTLLIHFTDGDGDFGIAGGQTDSIYNNDCTNHSYDSADIADPLYNVYYYVYRSENSDSCLQLPIQTAYIPNDTKHKAIEGLIQIYPTLSCPPAGSGSTDTIFFSVFIKDRAGHLSNRVHTPKIVVHCS